MKYPANPSQWLFTEPEQGVFNYTEGEITTDLAREQGKILRCHALVWHSQLAPWVEEKEWTPETLTAAITEHVQHVANHWKGQCYAWDVVNEALEEDGSWRESVFYQVLGEDYIKLAFRLAAEADPEAKLYYNDYNIERPGGKADGVVRIVEMLQEEGIRIDGVGMQTHYTAFEAPTLDDQIAVIESYAATGVEVSLTELDVRVTTPPSEEDLAQQREDYKNVGLPLPIPVFDKGLTLPGCRCMCPGPRLHRGHPLGLLRPIQLGARLLPRRGRCAALVR